MLNKPMHKLIPSMAIPTIISRAGSFLAVGGNSYLVRCDVLYLGSGRIGTFPGGSRCIVYAGGSSTCVEIIEGNQ